MHTVEKILLETMLKGLKRRTITTCSKWAEQYRILGQPYPGKYSFRHHPWLKAMHDSTEPENIGQKAAQMGFTETMLNIALFHIDVHGMDVLYVLPNSRPDAADFSSARFGLALEMSEHLKNLFSDTSNVGHKRTGNANLYIRGSKSRSQLKSIPTSVIFLDEEDEMPEKNVPLALQRAAGQRVSLVWHLSTPTYPEFGINKRFLDSNQQHFFFKCPSCSRFIELKYPDSFVVTADRIDDPRIKESHVICTECKAILPQETKRDWLADGTWVPTHSLGTTAGWYVNQMYSTNEVCHPVNLAKTAINAQTDPGAEQELYNSLMGLPRIVSGAGVTDADIRACQEGTDYRMVEQYDGGRLVTAGIDVGKMFHVEIDEWLLPHGNQPIVDISMMAKPRILRVASVPSIEEVEQLLYNFRVQFAVIDSQPEKRLALEFANRHHGRVRLCSYEVGIDGKQIHPDHNEPRVRVDRTSWLDLSQTRFKRGGIVVPRDIPLEYQSHIKNIIRVYATDKNENKVGRWITPKGEDHYAHARNYAEIALPLALSNGQAVDMRAPI